jgi:hypothetical protein
VEKILVSLCSWFQTSVWILQKTREVLGCWDPNTYQISVPIIHSVYITLLAIITVTRVSNMLPTISNPVSLISRNDHFMAHVTTTSTHAVGWMQRWTILAHLLLSNTKMLRQLIMMIYIGATASRQPSSNNYKPKPKNYNPVFTWNLYTESVTSHIIQVYPYMVTSDSTMTNGVSIGPLFHQALPSSNMHRLWSC